MTLVDNFYRQTLRSRSDYGAAFLCLSMKKWMLPLLALVGAAACQPQEDLVQMTNQGPAQGSTYSISYVVEAGVDYRHAIDSLLKEMDRQMSLWVEDSEISRLNRGETVVISEDFRAVLQKSLLYSSLTEGAFDITVAPLIKAWGFSGGTYSDSVNLDSLLQFVGMDLLAEPLQQDTLLLPRGVQVDVNAVAQGWTVDRIVHLLERKGVDRYMVEVGGEVRCKGENIHGRNWRIGIEKPEEDRIAGQFQAIVALDSMSLATSGNYRKFWVDETGQRVVHTIDPETGRPVVSNLLSASIIAESATLADALATACMVEGLQGALEMVERFPSVEAYFIVGNKAGGLDVIQTQGWSAYEVK